VNQQNQNAAAGYPELLRDLAHDEPKDGYARETLKLTATQVAAVVEHAPTIVGEACVDADEQIVALVKACLAVPQCNPMLLAGIGAAIVNAVKARAPGWIISDVLNACADAGEARRVDARFERDGVAA
jgi:hypothetical protein